jgi:hypothetical protein
MVAKCPKCEGMVTRANISDLKIGAPMQRQWNGIAYTCPYCSTILSVAIDPIAIKTDIVNEILHGLGKK